MLHLGMVGNALIIPAQIYREFTNGTSLWAEKDGEIEMVSRCPVEGYDLKVSAYPTGSSTDGETIPALFRRFGKRVRGYLMMTDTGPVFVPHPDYVQFIQPKGRT